MTQPTPPPTAPSQPRKGAIRPIGWASNDKLLKALRTLGWTVDEDAKSPEFILLNLAGESSPEDTVLRFRSEFPSALVVPAIPKGEPEMLARLYPEFIEQFVFLPADEESVDILLRSHMEQEAVLYEHAKLLEENIESYELISLYRSALDLIKTQEWELLRPNLLQRFRDEFKAQGVSLYQPRDGFQHGFELELRGSVGLSAEDRKTLSLFALPYADRLMQGVVVRSSEGEDYQHMWIPLTDDGRFSGVVDVVKRARKGFLNRDMHRATLLAELASISIGNAMQLEKIRAVLRTRFSQTFSREMFSRHIVKEIAKAGRYNRNFSLIAIHLHADDDAVKKRIWETLLEALRSADVMEEPTNDSCRVYLPEADFFEALWFVHRVRRDVVGRAAGTGGRAAKVLSAFKVATYPYHGSTVRSLEDALQTRTAAPLTKIRRLNEPKQDFWTFLNDGIEEMLFDADPLLTNPNHLIDRLLKLLGVHGWQRNVPRQLFIHIGDAAKHWRAFEPIVTDSRFRRIMQLSSYAASGQKDAAVDGDLPHLPDAKLQDLMLLTYLDPHFGYCGILRRENGAWAGYSTSGVWETDTTASLFKRQYFLSR